MSIKRANRKVNEKIVKKLLEDFDIMPVKKLNQASTTLGLKYGISRFTAARIIRSKYPAIKTITPLNEEEKEKILILYDQQKHEVFNDKIRAVSAIIGRSFNAIRNIILKRDNEKFFDHKRFYF